MSLHNALVLVALSWPRPATKICRERRPRVARFDQGPAATTPRFHSAAIASTRIVQIDNTTLPKASPCTAPRGWGMCHPIYQPGEHQTRLFNDSGTYTFRVEQIPGSMLAVNVVDTDARELLSQSASGLSGEPTVRKSGALRLPH